MSLMHWWGTRWTSGRCVGSFCLLHFSVEEIEHVLLFGLMITGFLMICLGTAMLYTKIKGGESFRSQRHD